MDPLSALGIASGVAGLTSLGIQICQGLLGYYGSYKDARTDIRRLYCSVERLEGNLTQVSKALSLVSPAMDQEIVLQAKQSLSALHGGLKYLEKELQKIKLTPAAGGSAWGEIKAVGRRALYPFRESTIIKLKEIVDDSLRHLSIILNALQL
jgi:hypothetical protein